MKGSYFVYFMRLIEHIYLNLRNNVYILEKFKASYDYYPTNISMSENRGGLTVATVYWSKLSQFTVTVPTAGE